MRDGWRSRVGVLVVVVVGRLLKPWAQELKEKMGKNVRLKVKNLNNGAARSENEFKRPIGVGQVTRLTGGGEPN